MDHRQALQENRRGRILVSDTVPEEVRQLLRQRLMIVAEERHDVYAQVLTAYCPEFEPLELGMTAPLYTAEITQNLQGLSIAFRRQ